MQDEVSEAATGAVRRIPTRPLEDIRILALEQYGAGPFGSVQLADLGADVIKIEDPRSGGDIGRYVPPFQQGENSLFFETFNRNKRSLSLDLTNPGGREVFEDLVTVSDAVYSNLRGDVPARLRIRFEDLQHRNPTIVCCSLSGFGTTGPRAASPAYDYVIQGLAGWMSLTGEPDGPPTKSGLSLVDYSGGLAAALALLAGVHAARRDGVGMNCDVSLFDVAIAMLTYPAAWYLSGGLEPHRTSRSSHPSMVPFQLFPTADGWLVVACPKEKFWRRLAEAVGRADLLKDPRFIDFSARARNRAALEAELDKTFRRRTTADWLSTLSSTDIPCGPVNSVADALADPQTVARGLIVETAHPTLGTVRQVAGVTRVGAGPIEHRRAPQRGEDAHHVLRQVLKYDDARIEGLRRTGAFGDERPQPQAER